MNKFDGLFLIHKASGVTSHDVVNQMRKILSTREIGHCGTLDPLAEGLMILIAGEATKLSQYLLEGNKSYRLEMQLGTQTDTLDVTGEVLSEKNVDVSTDQILQQVPAFQGEKEWKVPIYSAIKVKGKKLYEVAREKKADASQEIQEVPVKKMKFWDIEFLSKKDQRVSFHLHCSKGSYVRTWVDEFGKSLGCGAALSQLLRTSSQPYRLEQSQSLQDLEQTVRQNKIPSCFIPIENALPGAKKIKATGPDIRLLKNGQLGHDLRLQLIRVFDPQKDQVALIMNTENGKPLALVGLDSEKGFVIRRVFNLV